MNNWACLIELVGALFQEPASVPKDSELSEKLAAMATDAKSKHKFHIWVIEEMKRSCLLRLADEFWKQLDVEEVPVIERLPTAVSFLHTVLFARKAIIDIIGKYVPSYCHELWEEILLVMKAVVFVHSSQSVDDIALDYLTHWFRIFQSFNVTDKLDENAVVGGFNNEAAEKLLVSFHDFIEQLQMLQLTHFLLGRPLVRLVDREVKKTMERMCTGQFNSPQLDGVMQWVDSVLFKWMTVIIEAMSDSFPSQSLSVWKERLNLLTFHVFGSLRIAELFDIIVDFPDSEPAITDLKECINQTGDIYHLIQSLKESFELRLLHPGANTPDILTQYVSAIKALRLLDPTGVMLEQACQPVKQYLKRREDTVRCIVSNLTDDSGNELSDELLHSDPRLIEESDASDYEDAENWVPDPVDADPEKTAKSRKSSDIISLLVNIYGSKDLFVAEYQSLLADRLLTSLSYDIDKEARNLELLKLRFGETSLQYCEVMLKDVADSRRINTLIHEKMKMDTELNVFVLSHIFWPILKDENFKLPAEISRMLETYTEGFASLKANRTLEWKGKLGIVDLTVELSDRTVELSVTPAQATVLMAFQNQSSWSVDALSREVQMTQSLLAKRLAFWVGHGVLREDMTSTFSIVEKQQDGSTRIEHRYDDMEGESNEGLVEDQRREKLQVCWSFIVGMLTNLGSLPLERIHSMLKMFAVQGPSSAGSDCSLQELKSFLDFKVKEEKLTLASGVYSLAKTT
ncbi:anaphase-promoting complex subunit 2-like [Corticium candelabrum]|uniref:anaphase-promoting complex subunit 2-like n=1 Tax=Corticium candelabrum TaxID=121492 RepID=UPI002E2741D7|nr:anaphase-promoting complex subunit 2-like [Corticium candelabrum]